MTRAASPLGWVLALAGVLALPAGATVPELLSYQGVLVYEASGKVAPDGDYVLTFRIWDQPTAGALRFEEQDLTVAVRNGLYSVLLGGTSPIPLSDVFAEPTRFMEVTIESGPAGIVGLGVMPRQLIASVPYAMLAKEADVLEGDGGPEVPTGALILWDQVAGCGNAPHTCPCGYSEATQFQGMTIRGADTAERNADVPDDPGVSMGTPGGSGKYGDVLTAAEVPEHTHIVDPSGPHGHGFSGFSVLGSGEKDVQALGSYVATSVAGIVTEAAGGHTHTTDLGGGGGPHRHPSRKVLFCRRD